MFKMTSPLILLLPLVTGALLTGLDYPLLWDEPRYYEVLTRFGENYLPSISDLESYGFYPAPLSMVLFGIWGKAFGFEPWKLRLLSLLFNLGSILIFYRILEKILREYGSPVNPLLFSLLLLFNPYYYVTSFLIFSDSFASLFFMIALLNYIENRPISSGFFAGLAILSRQFYLFFPFALLLSLLIERRLNFYRSKRFLGALLPLIMFFPFFYLWEWNLSPIGGHTILNLNYFNYFIAVLAFYSLPLLIQLRGIFINQKSLIAFFALPIFIVEIPSFPYFVGILYFASSALGVFGPILLGMLWVAGIIILANLPSFNLKAKERVMVLGIILFTFMMLFSHAISDKYLLTVLPLILITFAPQTRPGNRILMIWLAALIIFTSFYSYLLFFKLINQPPFLGIEIQPSDILRIKFSQANI